jgi:putative ABC transport system substrate-binding protein
LLLSWRTVRRTPTSFAVRAKAFLEGLRDLGYVEGQTIAIEWKWAENKIERFPELAAELVRANVDVIVTGGTSAATALKSATTTIPIVMAIIGDPVAAGLVDSLARPGGNANRVQHHGGVSRKSRGSPRGG